MFISNIIFIQTKEFAPCIQKMEDICDLPEDLLTTTLEASGQDISQEYGARSTTTGGDQQGGIP